VIQSIKNREDIHYHQYDCQRKTMTEKLIKNDYHLLIIEGAYALREEFRDVYDLTYLILVNSRTQIQRIKTRNELLFERFVQEWIPMENKYIETFDLKKVVNRCVIN
jgi:uridine kinase